MTIPVVTVDGPSGSGKGTVSKAVAEALRFEFLDSGAIYRVVGLAALEQGVALDDAVGLVALVSQLSIRFDFRGEGAGSVLLDGRGIGEAIRSEAVAGAASRVAAVPAVRAALLELQRSFRQPPGLVADGRDMGTVVFPDAPCKIFLDASAEERARRRCSQLKENGISVRFPLLLTEIRERDKRDRERTVAPLVAAPDAETVDTTHLGIDEVVEKVLDLVKKRLS